MNREESAIRDLMISFWRRFFRKKSLWLKVNPRATQYAKVASCAYIALGACDGLNWLMMISKQAITEHRWSGVEPDYITPKTYFHSSLIP